MELCDREKIAANCTCTYDCFKKGKCCACIDYHRKNNELPGCYFPKEEEQSYNRSIKFFCETMSKKGFKL